MIKNIGVFILELFFTSKEEYDIKSPKFNPRKIILLTVFFCSLVVNILLLSMVGRVGKSLLELDQQCSLALKNQTPSSSNVAQPTKLEKEKHNE